MINKKELYKVLLVIVIIFSTNVMLAQRTETISSAYHIKIENKQQLLEKLQADNSMKELLWQKELDNRKRELPKDQKVSDNIKVEVKPAVELKPTEEGSDEMNLNVNFSYETVKAGGLKQSSSTAKDDFPSGAYNPSLSNACMLTCDYMKTKISKELAPYLTKGSQVTISITGETDGSPIRAAIPYKGEFGVFENKPIFLNGQYSDISINPETGITSNAQLAFLRTQGVERFLKNEVPELKNTDNKFIINAVENKEKGNQYRRISIDITIHGAFNQQMSQIDNASSSGTAVPKSIPIDITSDVDVGIPSSASESSKTFALIIANENYSNELVAYVPFASNDGKVFSEYCKKTLGIPERQVKYYNNATLNQITDGVDWITGIMKSWGGEARIIVYYAGHGIPDQETKYSFLIPSDANPEKKNQLYGLGKLYHQLSLYPAEIVTIFIDACFSGAKRNGEMLVQGTRSVRISVNEEELQRNMIVFSAANGNQTASPYTEQKHGLFTYYLLKTLKESRGNINYGDLFDKVKTSVTREASLNSKEQTPSINVSMNLMDTWKLINTKEQ